MSEPACSGNRFGGNNGILKAPACFWSRPTLPVAHHHRHEVGRDVEHAYRAAYRMSMSVACPAVRDATFHRPFSSGDRYTARLSVEHVGTSSIRYAWQVLNGNALAVEGGYTVIHVAADGRSAPLPEALRSALQSLQLQPGV
jgi:acyl-CoA thioesterase FadM